MTIKHKNIDNLAMEKPSLARLKPDDWAALQLIAASGSNVTARLSEDLGVTRQAASQRLRKLEKAGLVKARGETRRKRFFLAQLDGSQASYPVKGLAEDLVWRQLCFPVVADLKENVRDAWQYGITEMVNNAIDHSGSESITAGISRDALYSIAWVLDGGEGIFRKIQRVMNFYDPREALLELAKGKFTTDPQHHSGEGIFFSSKIFEQFSIRSGNLAFQHDDGQLDILLEGFDPEASGTLVVMRQPNDWPRTTKEIFDQFASPDSYTFDRTIVPVRLVAHEGEKLVSRSQAKRLTMRFERFRHVILDFVGVNEIGQAFADEVFRVFAQAHPDTLIVPVNMKQDVKDMVNRALTGLPNVAVTP